MRRWRTHFTRLKLPFIYRIHEDPKAEKVQKFIDYASSFGIQIYGTASEMSQEALQEIMRKVEGEPYADVLSMMLLRSMQQARYSESITMATMGLLLSIIPTLPVPSVGIRT